MNPFALLTIAGSVAMLTFCLVALKAMVDAETSPSVDVVVVGAGYAGLSAARELHAKGANVVVFEANNYSGGRTLNFDFGTVRPGAGIVELGGQWLDGDRQDQPHAWQLIVDELGFKVQNPHYGSGRAILYSRTNPDGAYFDVSHVVGGALGTLPPAAQREVVWFIKEIGRLYEALPTNRSYLDSLNLWTWTRQNLLEPEARAMVRNFQLSLNYQEPQFMSLLSVVSSWKTNLVDMLDRAQSYRVVGGTQAPPQAMAAALGDRVHLSCPVTAIAQDSEMVRVTACAKEVQAKYVILTGSPWTSLKIDFTPSLPSAKAHLFRWLPMGNAVKMMLAYDTPFWRNANFSGFISSNVEVDGVLFPACLDNSPLDSTVGVILCFCMGDTSIRLMSEPPATRREVLIAYLVRAFGERARNPFHYVDYDWGAAPYIGGGFQPVPPPGVMTQQLHTLSEDFGRVTWAGSDTRPVESKNWGYIDGAIQSGWDAAARTLAKLDIAGRVLL